MKKLQAMERRPWLLALLAAAGVTLLVPSALALLGPPELLDAAVALGDVRLGFGLFALFALSALLARLLFRRRREFDFAEEEEEPPRVEHKEERSYLR